MRRNIYNSLLRIVVVFFCCRSVRPSSVCTSVVRLYVPSSVRPSRYTRRGGVYPRPNPIRRGVHPGASVGAGFIPALTPATVIIPFSPVPHIFDMFCGVRAGINPAPTGGHIPPSGGPSGRRHHQYRRAVGSSGRGPGASVGAGFIPALTPFVGASSSIPPSGGGVPNSISRTVFIISSGSLQSGLR